MKFKSPNMQQKNGLHNIFYKNPYYLLYKVFYPKVILNHVYHNIFLYFMKHFI
ncbi:hypothetical protein YYC_04827 [Plasmodium yoelii 17X]|uniref:Uncharacterized protein n=2 Tax=Plasmodium yoelii TaxID=5861 RepID=Q7RKC4_PLAYO|nr:hypothetical protein [Plasmodium yoelii yoelii]ETB57319.1 hypothetical protein YYC_04827 [Plasmodium yoelii 17X]